MGTSVYGRDPDSEAGGFFIADVLVWGQINCLNDALCSDLLGEETIGGIGYNSGHGPDNQEVCTQMANRFDQWMEHNVDGLQLDLGMYVDKENRLSTAETVPKNPDVESMSTRNSDLSKTIQGRAAQVLPIVSGLW